MIRRLAIAALILMVAAACAQTETTSSTQLVLGAIYPLSGPQAAGGKSELAGVQAALRVSGANVRLQVIDAVTPQAASAAVETLVKQYHVPVILGTYGSTLAAAASAFSRARRSAVVAVGPRRYWSHGDGGGFGLVVSTAGALPPALENCDASVLV